MENGHGVFSSSGPKTTGSNKELKTVKNIGFENGGFSPTSETSRELNQVQKIPENPHNASCPFVYKDDVVRSIKDDSLVGIATEVAGDFDSEEEYSESDDDDDTDDGGGDIDGEEAHNVQAASDPTGQLGLVVDVNISVDLRVSSGAIIADVSSRGLQRVRDFAVGDYVVHGPWLGRVDDILDNVTVLFDDGSICKVLKADPLRLKPVSKNILDYSSFPYYPGLRVRAVSSSVYKSGRWLSGLWKPSRLEGTVTKVQVGAVYVYWIASANPGYGSDSTTAPPEEQNPKNLTVLSCFSHANWQLGDWCMFSPTEDRAERYSHLMSMDHCLGSHTSMSDRSDRKAQSARSGDHINLVSKSYTAGDNNTAGNNGLSDCCSNSFPVSRETSHDSLPVSRKKIHKIFVKRDKRVRKREETYERALQIVNTRTRVVVAWQDGSREFGLDSTSLIPIHTPGDQDFFPEEYVVEKSLDEVVHATEVKRIGVMKTVDARERTACVTWLKPVSRPEDPREFDGEEIVSLYELDEHPDYDYCYGDVVIRLFPVTVSADLGSSKNQVEEHDRQVNFVEYFDVRSCDHADDVKVDEMLKDCNNVDFSHLSWVGHVTGLGGGDIEVAWADGTVSKVGPQAIYAVARDDDGNRLEKEVKLAMMGSGLQNPTSREAEKSMNCVIQAENSPGRNGPLSFTVAAIGFVSKLASGLLSQARKQIDILGSDSRDPTKRVEQEISEGSGTGDADAECEIQADNHNAQMTFTASEECYAVSSPAVAEVGSAEKSDSSLSEVLDAGMAHSVDGPFSFKHFDVTKDPLDHHYLDSGEQVVTLSSCFTS
ncbi:putative ubiquitin-conjugating enzyme E2 23 [Acorus calamus]|uniref:Ubiquitin-conjugating enzyme E2 23 n=1 Tax=Acorus calamus TaxID=4465 RepID=A0AAV9D2B1_ACOCL|nr:putative ubiquitin-conjugating enzyme E2 23 [Acorus calamus]